MIDDALQLMLAGMGTVFAFLLLLVGATRLMSKLLLRYTAVSDDLAANQPEISADELAAATAAVRRYREQQQRTQ